MLDHRLITALECIAAGREVSRHTMVRLGARRLIHRLPRGTKFHARPNVPELTTAGLAELSLADATRSRIDLALLGDVP